MDRVENSRQGPEEVLVPAELDDVVEAVELLDLRHRHAQGELVELLQLGNDDAAPIGHGANSTAKTALAFRVRQELNGANPVGGR